MIPIPERYSKIIEPLIETARGFLENGEELVPFAFVGNFEVGTTIPVRLQADSEEAKDQSARAIKSIAERHNADFVFTIMEAWSLRSDKLRMVDEIYERYGSIGEAPDSYKIEVVSFSLETRHGVWVAQCPIKPKGYSKKKRTIGTPEFRHFTEAQGRFVDLLPVKEGGVLH